MSGRVVGFREMDCIAPDARITEINGPIGFMRRDLRHWLDAAMPLSAPLQTAGWVAMIPFCSFLKR